jgi:hypothetical protein
MHQHIRSLALCALVVGAVPASAVLGQAPASMASATSTTSHFASPSALAPFKAGSRYFFVDASGTLQVREGEQGHPRALFSAGSFSNAAPSPNGRYIAYTVGPAGPGPFDVRIRDVQRGQDLPDVLHDSRISPAPWSHDNKGFLYVREERGSGRERVYYHGLGRAPANDALIFSQFDHPEWRYAARVSDDGDYAVFTISYPADAHTRIYFIDLADAGKPNFGAPVVKLVQAFDARYEFIDNAGSYFFLQTDRAAPLGRIILANTDVIREASWPAAVPETSDTLLYARTAGDEYLVAVYRSSSGASIARVYGPEDPSILRNEIRSRMDSLRKARTKDDDRRPTRGVGLRGLRGNGPAIRLAPRTGIPIPAGATILAMNSLADDQQLFYTVKLSDGALQSFMYDVKESRNVPLAEISAAPASPAGPASLSNIQ